MEISTMLWKDKTMVRESSSQSEQAASVSSKCWRDSSTIEKEMPNPVQ